MAVAAADDMNVAIRALAPYKAGRSSKVVRVVLDNRATQECFLKFRDTDRIVESFNLSMSAYNILFQVNLLRNPFCRQVLRQEHYSRVAVLGLMPNYTVDGAKLRRGFRDLTEVLVPEAAWRGHALV